MMKEIFFNDKSMSNIGIITTNDMAHKLLHLCANGIKLAYSSCVFFTCSLKNLRPHLHELKKEFYSLKRTLLIFKNTPIKAAFFDIDRTLIKQTIIEEVGMLSENFRSISNLTLESLASKISYKDSLIKRCELLAGIPKWKLNNVFTKIIYRPGVKKVFATLRQQKIPIFLVSGGFSPITQLIANDLLADGVISNTFCHDEGVLNGKVKEPIVDGNYKKEFFLSTCADLNISPKQAMIVGDGTNDILMAKAAGFSFGFDPCKELQSVLDGWMFDSFLPLNDLLKFNLILGENTYVTNNK